MYCCLFLWPSGTHLAIFLRNNHEFTFMQSTVFLAYYQAATSYLKKLVTDSIGSPFICAEHECGVKYYGWPLMFLMVMLLFCYFVGIAYDLVVFVANIVSILKAFIKFCFLMPWGNTYSYRRTFVYLLAKAF